VTGTEVGRTSDSRSIWSYRDGDVAVIVLDKPAARNAVGTRELELLEGALGDCIDAGAIVLASEGHHFCAGADLAEVTSIWGNRNRVKAFLALFHVVAEAIASSPVPVIAAVQGLALAGGLELALACDLIVAADDAEFGDQHINVDLIPGGGGSQRLPLAIGARRALALQLLGTRIDAGTALGWGLVHSVCTREDLRSSAVMLAAQIAAHNRLAVHRIRELGRAATALPLPEGLAIELGAAIKHLSETPKPDSLQRFVAAPSEEDDPAQPGRSDVMR
jgi:enoyl-CoA hydratase